MIIANFHMGKSAQTGLFVHYYDEIIQPFYNYLHPNATVIRPNTRFGRTNYYLSLLREGWTIARPKILPQTVDDKARY